MYGAAESRAIAHIGQHQRDIDAFGADPALRATLSQRIGPPPAVQERRGWVRTLHPGGR